MRTAVVGAGIAGLACSRALLEHGNAVTIFEAGSGPGGRITSHRFEAGDGVGAFCADHGARAFSARFELFIREAQRWCEAGHAARWTPVRATIKDAGAPVDQSTGPARFVGTPTMDTPIRALADQIGASADIRYNTAVRSIHHTSAGWCITDSRGQTGVFDSVATAVPAPQAVGLLAEVAHLHTASARVPMSPCWSLAVRFADRLPIGFDAARVDLGGRHAHAGVLAWMDRESSKPGRPGDEVWVLSSAADWARQHIDSPADEITETMLGAFFAAAWVDTVSPVASHARLWKAALPVAPLCDGCLYDEQLRIGACGDWCFGARVEGAYLSGLAMAERLMGGHRDFLATCSASHHSA